MDKKGHHYTNRGHDVNKTPRFCTTMPLCAASGKGSTLTFPAVTREFDRRRMRGLMPSLGQRPGNWKEIVEIVDTQEIVDTHIWELGELWVSQVHLCGMHGG